MMSTGLSQVVQQQQQTASEPLFNGSSDSAGIGE
jgi:hypothetical protein